MSSNPYESPRIPAENARLSDTAKFALRALITVPTMIASLLLGLAASVVLVRFVLQVDGNRSTTITIVCSIVILMPIIGGAWGLQVLFARYGLSAP